MANKRIEPDESWLLEIRHEDRADLGPAMQALDKKRREFVLAYILIGGTKPERAAAMAGYGGQFSNQDPDYLKQCAKRLMSDPKVSAAIAEESARQYESHLVLGQAHLLEIISNPKTKDNVRLRAIELAAKLGGLGNKTEHEVKVTNVSQLSQQEKFERAVELAKKLGVSDAEIRKRLGFADEQPLALTALPMPVEDYSDI